MRGKNLRLGGIIAAAVVLAVGVLWLVLSLSVVGVTSEGGAGGLPLSVDDLSAIPQSVAEDAVELASGLFGDSPEKCNDFANQLLAAYSEAKDKDIVILFNPGGWGWNVVENSPGWWSIFNGMKSELDISGYTSLWLDYQRTVNNLRGQLDEMGELIIGYSSKAQNLASRVEFLTDNIPDLKIIIAGESNGAIICDRVMNILADNPQVYSIQTGPPFWHTTTMLDRTLVVNDNGIIPDSFSHGDFVTMFRAGLRELFGSSQPEDVAGTVFYYVRAPGHDYWWQYPKVAAEITNFLEQNFGIK